jgi:hypothetical protein
MRRLLISLALLGAVGGGGVASAQPTPDSATIGRIAALSASSITVDGRRDLTCRLGKLSPSKAGLRLGDRVGIACARGVLSKLRKVPRAAAVAGTVKVLGPRSIGIDGEHDLTCRRTDASPELGDLRIGDRTAIACADGVLVEVAKAPEPPAAVDAGGTIVGLGADGITVRGERILTCRIADRSPGLGDYRVGDRVGIACIDGVLAKIVRLPDAAASVADAAGEITALGPGAITVRGEHELGCRITDGSPNVAEFKVGDRVKIICANGVLTTIARVTPTPPPAGEKEQPTTTSLVGAITALNTTSIGVHGERDLTCTVGSTSPKLGDYKIGDRVKIACANGVLAAIGRTEDGAPAPTTTPEATTATGTIALLGELSITIRGERETSCTIGAGSPKLGEFGLGDHVKISCANAVLTAIARVV